MNSQEAKVYLGKAIAQKLIRFRGTYKDMAKTFKVSTTTIANITNGYYERLSIRMYMKFADKLDLVIEVTIEEKETCAN